jgi:hypothetical protein
VCFFGRAAQLDVYYLIDGFAFNVLCDHLGKDNANSFVAILLCVLFNSRKIGYVLAQYVIAKPEWKAYLAEVTRARMTSLFETLHQIIAIHIYTY